MFAVCPAGVVMFTCGKCRIQAVPDAQRCTTMEMVRAHYGVKPVVQVKPVKKRVRKTQAKA